MADLWAFLCLSVLCLAVLVDVAIARQPYWSLTSRAIGRYWHNAVVIRRGGSDMMVVTGGTSSGLVDVFDVKPRSWATAPVIPVEGLPTSSDGFSVAVDNNVLVFSGEPENVASQAHFLNTNTWTLEPFSLSSPVSGHCLCRASYVHPSSGHTIVVVLVNGEEGTLPTTHSINTTSHNVWINGTAGTGPSPRVRSSCAIVFPSYLPPETQALAMGQPVLILFGGTGKTSVFGDTFVLSLATNTWQEWTTVGNPSPPAQHSAASLLLPSSLSPIANRSVLLLTGGSTTPTGQYGHTGVDLGSGHLVFFALDLTTRSWHVVLPTAAQPTDDDQFQTPSLPVVLSFVSLALSEHTQQLILFGGIPAGYVATSDRTVVMSLPVLEVQPDSVRGTLPPRLDHTAAASIPGELQLEGMVLFGGNRQPATFLGTPPTSSQLTLVNDTYLLDATPMRWTRLNVVGAVPSARCGHGFRLVYVQYGTAPRASALALQGGVDSNGNTIHQPALLYMQPTGSIAVNTWVTLPDVGDALTPSMQLTRAFHAFVARGPNVILWGGLCRVDTMEFCNASQIVTGTIGTAGISWITSSPAGTPPPPRFGVASALSNDFLVIVGGFDMGFFPTSTVFVLEVDTNVWRTLSQTGVSAPAARVFSLAVPVNNGALTLVHGGLTGPQVLSDTELFDPTSGTWVTPPAYRAAYRPPQASTMGGAAVMAGQRLLVYDSVSNQGNNASSSGEPLRVYWSGLGDTLVDNIQIASDELCIIYQSVVCDTLFGALRRCVNRGTRLNVDSSLPLDIAVLGEVRPRESISPTCSVKLHSGYITLPEPQPDHSQLPSPLYTIDCSGVELGMPCVDLVSVADVSKFSIRDARISAALSSAIVVRDGVSLSLVNSVVEYSASPDHGGCVQVNKGSLSLNTVLFNECLGSQAGGAIAVTSGSLFAQYTTIQNCVTDGSGGAISGLAATITLSHYCRINNNNASQGGAIYTQSCTVNVDTSDFFANYAEAGGAWYSTNDHVNIQSVTSFVQNLAKVGGGAVYLDRSTRFNAEDVLFWRNRATFGGALYSLAQADPLLDRLIFQNNVAAATGGAVYFGPLSAANPFFKSPVFIGNTQYSGSMIATGIRTIRVIPHDHVITRNRTLPPVTGNVTLQAVSGAVISPAFRVAAVDLFGFAIMAPQYWQSADSMKVFPAKDTTLLGGVTSASIVDGVATFDRLRVLATPGSSVVVLFVFQLLSTEAIVHIAPCPAGSYVNENNVCVPCPSGTATPLNVTLGPAPSKSAACVECPPDTHSTHGQRCQECSPLTFQRSSGAHHCEHCETGRYFVPPYTCAKCPSTGAICDNVVYAKEDFFVSRQNDGTTSSLLCSLGRCRSALDDCQGHYAQGTNVSQLAGHPLDLAEYVRLQIGVQSCCGPNRVPAVNNPLCGKCLPGYYEWSGNCVLCHGYSKTYITLFILLSWLALLALHRLSQSTTALSNILFYFVQIANLFVAPSGFLSSVLTVLSLSAPDSSSCAAPLTPLDKLLLRLALPAVMVLELLATGIISHLVWRVREFLHTRELRRSGALVVNRPSLLPLQKSPYIRTLCALYLFSFTAVSATVLRFFNCVDVTPKVSVVASEPGIICHSGAWQDALPLVVTIFIVIVVVLPVLVLVALLVAHSKSMLWQPRHRQRYGILYEIYNPRFYWWQCLVLLRRTCLVIVAAIVLDYVDKLLMASGFNVLFLLTHLMAQPYRHTRDNYLSTFLLTLITMVTLSLAHFDPPLSNLAQLLFLLVIFVPVTVIFLWIVPGVAWRALQRKWKDRNDNAKSDQAKLWAGPHSSLKVLNSAREDDGDDGPTPGVVGSSGSYVPLD